MIRSELDPFLNTCTGHDGRNATAVAIGGIAFRALRKLIIFPFWGTFGAKIRTPLLPRAGRKSLTAPNTARRKQ
jgi:hypothetical protein